MYDPFLNTIKILHIEVLWQMLLMTKESVEILEKQSLAQDKSKDYKNFYKSFKYLNLCRWKVIEISKEIERRVLK
jgi:hypothetical protein